MLYEKAQCWDKATSVYIKSKSWCVYVQCDSIGHLHVCTHHASLFLVQLTYARVFLFGEEEIVHKPDIS